METASSARSDMTFDALVREVHDLLQVENDAPQLAELEEVFRVLYAASLLKEEGRGVRARVVIAPPGAFPPMEGPPDGEHVVKFTSSHQLTTNEIKRLSPAAGFFHSAVVVWPEGDRGVRIWGLLNTGQRWMNQVAGGRKPVGSELPFPVIHVHDPGWLLFYHNYNLLAEWRGTEFFDARLDVFQLDLLHKRFEPFRRKMIEEVSDRCLSTTLNLESYAYLSALIGQQFVKRLISLVRSSGHGGTLIFLPEGNDGIAAVNQWVDCKYSVEPDAAGLRFRHLLQSMLRRVGQLCTEKTSPEKAWEVFQSSQDPELDQLEEAFFELARFFSDMMQVDGALVLDQRLRVVGFGGEIRVDRNVLMVRQAHDLEGLRMTHWNVQNDGTRHRSLYRLCSVEPNVMGFVISQDSQVRLIANVDDVVTFWIHTMV